MTDTILWRPSTAETRTKRGHGVTCRVTSKGKIPWNWQNFLRDSDNKTELFNLLGQKITQISTPNTVIVTRENDIASNHAVCIDGLSPCSHEEAVRCILLNVRDERRRGQQIPSGQSQWHRCSGYQCSFSPSKDWFAAAVGGLWTRKESQMDSCAWPSSLHRTGEGILFFHASTGCDVYQDSVVEGRSQHGKPGMSRGFWYLHKACGDNVWQVQYSYRSWIDMFARKQRPWSLSSNLSSTSSACEACSLWGRLHMESVHTRNKESCRLGLDKEG